MLPSAHESAALRAHSGDAGWWFRAKEEIVGEFLRSYLRDGARVLVLGCGGGATARHLRKISSHCAIVGLDIDPAAVAQCLDADPAGIYRVADLETDSLAEASSVDVVVALDILEHLENDGDLIRRVAICLKPGAVCIVNVPAHPWLFSMHDVRLGHIRRYRPRDIEALFGEQGFRVLHSTPLFMTTLLLLAIWRPLSSLSRRASARSDVGRRLPLPIDGALYAIARVEGRVARIGLPFGSSHLLVARKPGPV